MPTSALHITAKLVVISQLTELIDGVSLSVDGLGRALLPHEVLRVARGLLEGLSVAHAAGVVHADVKPSNILVPRTEKALDGPKLIDFGLARVTSRAEIARELVGATAQMAAVTWSTSQHLACTAPMGVDGDADAVVDTQCRVRGVDNLWVVDGSVLPAITSRGPHATIVMIGHRAAEFVAP